MINFLKNFGKGILYVFVLPFLLVALAIYGVVAFFIFIYLAIKGLILFFTGRSLYEDLPEDIEAKKRLGISNQTPVAETPSPVISSTIINNEPSSTPSNDPFYVPEYLKSEEPKEEIQEEATRIEEKPEPIETEEKTIEGPVFTQNNPQNGTILDISDEEEEEETSGIDIEYK